MIIQMADDEKRGSWNISVSPTRQEELDAGIPKNGRLGLILLELARDLLSQEIEGDAPPASGIALPPGVGGR